MCNSCQLSSSVYFVLRASKCCCGVSGPPRLISVLTVSYHGLVCTRFVCLQSELWCGLIFGQGHFQASDAPMDFMGITIANIDISCVYNAMQSPFCT